MGKFLNRDLSIKYDLINSYNNYQWK